MRSGEEIQAALRAFAARWHDYDGGERQGAQTFLNELATCYGTDLFAEGVKFEDPLVPAVAAYGWPKAIAQDGAEIVRRLLQLNREISAGSRPYDPFNSGDGQGILAIGNKDLG